jgi:hypothetical protein
MAPDTSALPSEPQDQPKPRDQLKKDPQSRLSELPAEWIVEILRKSDGEIAVRFASGICGYYVMSQRDNDELQVIYDGPHGPENEPARISMENFCRLQEESDKINLVPKSETSFIYF